MKYEGAKTKDYGVNLCEGCWEKQREIDRLKEEVERLKQALKRKQRQQREGFFGASTPSAQVPVKATARAENQAKKGGAKVGPQGHGRQVFQRAEADEVRVAKVEEEKWRRKSVRNVGVSCRRRVQMKGRSTICSGKK